MSERESGEIPLWIAVFLIVAVLALVAVRVKVDIGDLQRRIATLEQERR